MSLLTILQQVSEAQRLVAATEADMHDREEHENAAEVEDVKIILDAVHTNLRAAIGLAKERYSGTTTNKPLAGKCECGQDMPCHQ